MWQPSALSAQLCDPGVAPIGLMSFYTPGMGAVLEWDAVPGSVGVLIRATAPNGATVSRRVVGIERDRLLVPDALLSPGIYSWQVQAACSLTPPFNVTPVSGSAEFVKTIQDCGMVTDIDGNNYSTVVIGSQCWLGENLKVEHYRNGDALATGLTNAVWESTPNGAFALYEDNTANKAVYGLLYNGYAVQDSRGLCPSGWHVPSDAEWTQLSNQLGGDAQAGGLLKAAGTLAFSTGLWSFPNAHATNATGFAALPAGHKSQSGSFNLQHSNGLWWSSSTFTMFNGWYRSLSYLNGDLGRFSRDLNYGISLRCMKD